IVTSSDKTQLTRIGSKTTYPVYITIGNLPKDKRRKPPGHGQILLAYIPTTRLEHIHPYALRPLKKADIEGITIARGDGVRFRGHPIFAVHIGDYLEQILAT
ncbi:hypothetical protein OH76DRAFT_1330516, partial [Lentinus brumalis]